RWDESKFKAYPAGTFYSEPPKTPHFSWEDFLPGREGHVGGTAADNRLFVDSVIYRYRTGIPWRDLPERYGHWKAVHRRYRRWCESGVFMRVFEIMSRDADNEFVMLDARALAHGGGSRCNAGRAIARRPRARSRDCRQGLRLRRVRREARSARQHNGASPPKANQKRTPTRAFHTDAPTQPP